MDREQAAALLGLSGARAAGAGSHNPEPSGSRTLTRSDILHAYSRSARLTHPDLLADATPDRVRAANERFIRLTLARDVLLANPDADSSTAAPDDGHDGDHRQPAERLDDDWVPTKRPRKARGMGPSILAVIALAVVLVAVVSLQDSWRSQFGVVGRDLTAETTVVAVLSAPGSDREGCPPDGSCVLIDVTPSEDCASAVARFEVAAEDNAADPSTATRNLADLRAGRPTEVALAGTAATLLYLGCDG